MWKFNYITKFLYVALLLYPIPDIAQPYETKSKAFNVGVSLGYGSQQSFPFHSQDYNYSFSSFKILLNHRIADTGKWKIEITVEPSLYSAQHQLLNEHYVQPKHGSDFLEVRQLLIMEKRITEYALDIGLLLRHQTFSDLSFFIQGSVGPMISNRYTERMAKGFAFSDIIALGCTQRVGPLQLSLRTGLRHVSNFDFKSPNSGYNAVISELGVTYNL